MDYQTELERLNALPFAEFVRVIAAEDAAARAAKRTSSPSRSTPTPRGMIRKSTIDVAANEAYLRGLFARYGRDWLRHA